jgi:hypothetical protein
MIAVSECPVVCALATASGSDQPRGFCFLFVDIDCNIAKPQTQFSETVGNRAQQGERTTKRIIASPQDG